MWYSGVVIGLRLTSSGRTLHRVHYELDDEKLWHDLRKERWRVSSAPAAPPDEPPPSPPSPPPSPDPPAPGETQDTVEDVDVCEGAVSEAMLIMLDEEHSHAASMQVSQSGGQGLMASTHSSPSLWMTTGVMAMHVQTHWWAVGCQNRTCTHSQ